MDIIIEIIACKPVQVMRLTSDVSEEVMATDWEEIKKLAADFQRAQLSTSAQKLLLHLLL